VLTSVKFSDIKKLPPVSAARLAEIETFNETDISDCVEITEAEWKKARPAHIGGGPKTGVFVRIDADILQWLKSGGKGYQPRLNAALRFAMNNGF
jgi:uncharacterized protein (DUF4415 family)